MTYCKKDYYIPSFRIRTHSYLEKVENVINIMFHHEKYTLDGDKHCGLSFRFGGGELDALRLRKPGLEMACGYVCPLMEL